MVRRGWSQSGDLLGQGLSRAGEGASIEESCPQEFTDDGWESARIIHVDH